MGGGEAEQAAGEQPTARNWLPPPYMINTKHLRCIMKDRDVSNKKSGQNLSREKCSFNGCSPNYEKGMTGEQFLKMCEKIKEDYLKIVEDSDSKESGSSAPYKS
jgi:hypothetical protein